MSTTYQTYLYGAILDKEENGIILEGWQVNEKVILFASNEYDRPDKAMAALNFTEPAHNNWFATMVVRKDGEIIDEEIFDSSVIYVD
jgi:hypothetical protein